MMIDSYKCACNFAGIISQRTNELKMSTLKAIKHDYNIGSIKRMKNGFNQTRNESCNEYFDQFDYKDIKFNVNILYKIKTKKKILKNIIIHKLKQGIRRNIVLSVKFSVQ